jgi:hypothetical protein
VRSSPRELVVAPAQRLEPGRYVFAASREGMFGGRDFAYLRIVGPSQPVTTVFNRPDAGTPAVAKAVPPVAAALLAALFAFLLLRSFFSRPGGQKALWGIGFVLFAVAAGSEALAQRAGWTPGLFRTYYLAGGVLTVAYLGSGSAWLVLPRRARDVLLGALVVATSAAVAAVLLAPVDAGKLAAAPSGGPPANGALSGHAFLWAITLNSVGTLFLIGVSVLSILRRQRVRANVWIAAGAIVIAASTGLSRADYTSLVYLGELVGIALMFCGFRLSGPARKSARAPEHAPRPAMVAR